MHQNVDQVFSPSPQHLRHNSTTKLEDLNQTLNETYVDCIVDSYINKVMKWSGLCLQEIAILPLASISRYNYSKLSCFTDFIKHSNGRMFARELKAKATDAFRCQRWKIDSSFVMKCVPHLSETPKTIITRPTGKYNITRPITSMER